MDSALEGPTDFAPVAGEESPIEFSRQPPSR